MNLNCKYRRSSRCLLNRHEPVTNARCYHCQTRAEDRIVGLGDIVALTINLTPLHRLKPVLFKSKDCGCRQRQKSLNDITAKKPIVRVAKDKGWKAKDGKSCGCGNPPSGIEVEK